MRCPTCGADNPAGAGECRVCQCALTAPSRRRKIRRCPDCGARLGQWESTCAVCGASVEVVPPIPIPASILVVVMALLLLAFAVWAYQPWTLLAALPTPTGRAAESAGAATESVKTPTPTITATAVVIPTPRVLTITHTVQVGETLASIARRYGTTPEAIMRANGLSSPTIRVGQKLVVPLPPRSTPTPTPRQRQVTHIVQPGEYLELIAQRYGVTVRAIMEANAMTTDVIYPGQRLIIPVPATPERG